MDAAQSVSLLLRVQEAEVNHPSGCLAVYPHVVWKGCKWRTLPCCSLPQALLKAKQAALEAQLERKAALEQSLKQEQEREVRLCLASPLPHAACAVNADCPNQSTCRL
jgi:hypothetical protein